VAPPKPAVAPPLPVSLRLRGSSYNLYNSISLNGCSHLFLFWCLCMCLILIASRKDEDANNMRRENSMMSTK
jgi:hypothetical protein